MSESERVATVPTLPDDHADPDKYEYKVSCDENCHRGPVNWADAEKWIDDHEEVGHNVTVHIREKQGLNDSDLSRMPDNDCGHCGAGNVPGQVVCAVCGTALPH